MHYYNSCEEWSHLAKSSCSVFFFFEVPVVVQSHDNFSHTNRPYYRTQPSTLDNTKERCTNKPVCMVYTDVLEAAGGIKRSNSMSEEPRNKAQIYNAQKECRSVDVHSKDDVFDLLELLKTHQSEEEWGISTRSSHYFNAKCHSRISGPD